MIFIGAFNTEQEALEFRIEHGYNVRRQGFKFFVKRIQVRGQKKQYAVYIQKIG